MQPKNLHLASRLLRKALATLDPSDQYVSFLSYSLHNLELLRLDKIHNPYLIPKITKLLHSYLLDSLDEINDPSAFPLASDQDRADASSFVNSAIALLNPADP